MKLLGIQHMVIHQSQDCIPQKRIVIYYYCKNSSFSHRPLPQLPSQGCRCSCQDRIFCLLSSHLHITVRSAALTEKTYYSATLCTETRHRTSVTLHATTCLLETVFSCSTCGGVFRYHLRLRFSLLSLSIELLF